MAPTPAAENTKPGPGAAAPAVAGTPWEQMFGARRGVSSYKSTMQQGAQKATQYVIMNNGKLVKVKLDMGNKQWLIADLTKKITYVYDPQRNVVMKMDNSKSGMPGAPTGEFDEIGMLQKQNGKVTSGKLDGMDCWIVEMTGKSAATVWIDKKYGLYRQIKEGGRVMTAKVEDIDKVEDKEFALPPGVKVKDMADMMKEMAPKGGPPPGMPIPPK
jgi:outer membrane lipoprotein-sorting protein